ncbi:MAG: hypothetical protein ACLP4W_01305 [Mycobacterium sp.]|uniref:hypothetical protein n=1 Tax=Mycobacterium sp. TaxID=1785 RepID=UPI003F9B6F9A
MKRVLITGAGTGFGHEVAMRLAAKGFDAPGPFLTGFNDRMFQTYKSWEDDPSQRLFDYSELAFPRAQYDPEPVYATMTAVAAGEVDSYRNLEPKSMIEETKSLIEAPWHKKTTDGLGRRPDQIQSSYDMEPETPVSHE